MTKINRILQEWVSGTVVSSEWLKRRSVGKHLADQYVKSGWLERVGRGAFKRKGDVISWEGAICSLQKHFNCPIHPGGKTSLELQGYAHFIRMQEHNEFVLWKTPDIRIPKWFSEFETSNNSRFRIKSLHLFSRTADEYTEHRSGHLTFQISNPERAILELLADVPDKESFDETWHIFQGLSTLRPNVLQKLLQSCTSIKVKRLFLYLAEVSGHVWFEKLNVSEIDLGKGKRVVVPGGAFNKKYRITVPEKRLKF